MAPGKKEKTDSGAVAIDGPSHLPAKGATGGRMTSSMRNSIARSTNDNDKSSSKNVAEESYAVEPSISSTTPDVYSTSSIGAGSSVVDSKLALAKSGVSSSHGSNASTPGSSLSLWKTKKASATSGTSSLQKSRRLANGSGISRMERHDRSDVDSQIDLETNSIDSTNFPGARAVAGYQPTGATEEREARGSDRSGSGPFVAKANMVDEAETIFYAEDVQHDNSKRLMFFSIFLFICVAAVITTVIVLTRDDSVPCGGPEVCCREVKDQNTFQRCSCSNSTSDQYDNMADDRKGLYENILKIQKKSPFWSEYGSDDDWDRNSCNPLNQIILFGSDTDESMLSFETAPPDVQQTLTALLIVYVTLNGVRWDDDSGWGDDNAPCDWFGVGCLFNNVWHELKLPHNNLNGTIPSALQYAFEMRDLDFSQNENISGTIPSEIGGTQKLSSLDLSHLQLNGTIPESLASYSRLGILDLRLNQLTGSIPDGMFQLPVLKELEVGHNSLNGSLPNSTYSAPLLAFLRVNNNKLTGTLPEQMEGLEALELLNVGENSLSGTIPEFLGKMKRLQFINLYNSGLTGSLPESFCENSTSLSRQVIVDCRITQPCSCCTTDIPESVPSNATVVECVEQLDSR